MNSADICNRPLRNNNVVGEDHDGQVNTVNDVILWVEILHALRPLEISLA